MKLMGLFPIAFILAACSAHTVENKTDAGVLDTNCDSGSCDWPAGFASSISNTLKTPIDENSAHCGAGMIWVHGDYCPKDDQKCIKYVRNDPNDQCAEFRQPVHCLAKTRPMSFCMAEFEAQNKRGEIPQTWVSWNQAKALAEAQGNRLCTDTEWTFAAMGEEMFPLPYGDGYHRDSTKCNIDRHITGVKVMSVRDPNSEGAARLRSYIVPSGSMNACRPPANPKIHDLSGNVDEFVYNEHGFVDHAPYVSGMKGGWFGHIRAASRPMTTAHNQWFYWYESSYRMCSDAK
jgi:hypothetical protein